LLASKRGVFFGFQTLIYHGHLTDCGVVWLRDVVAFGLGGFGVVSRGSWLFCSILASKWRQFFWFQNLMCHGHLMLWDVLAFGVGVVCWGSLLVFSCLGLEWFVGVGWLGGGGWFQNLMYQGHVTHCG
jgi:hypothetical protein